MTTLDFFQNGDPAANLSARVAGILEDLGWQPADTDPLYAALDGAAQREALDTELGNEVTLDLLLPYSRGAPLRAVGASVTGVTARAGEDDETYLQRVLDVQNAQGRTGSIAAYRAFARIHSAAIDDIAATVDSSPDEGRLRITLLATKGESVSRSDNLLGVPSAAVVTSTGIYLRDDIRRGILDGDLLTVAASPTEYRIAITVTPLIAHDRARELAYQYIDSNRKFNRTLYPSHLSTLLENDATIDAATITTFAASPYAGVGSLTASGAAYYDCQQNDTGVIIA